MALKHIQCWNGSQLINGTLSCRYQHGNVDYYFYHTTTTIHKGIPILRFKQNKTLTQQDINNIIGVIIGHHQFAIEKRFAPKYILCA